MEIDATQAFPGGVDILVNNAAYVAPVHHFIMGDPAEWERMVAVNVWGALHISRQFLPGMAERRRGKVGNGLECELCYF